MMERNYKVEIATCPNCGATCLVGHDDDYQVFCACCGKTFSPKDIKDISGEEYADIKAKAKIRHEKGGWIAYTF